MTENQSQELIDRLDSAINAQDTALKDMQDARAIIERLTSSEEELKKQHEDLKKLRASLTGESLTDSKMTLPAKERRGRN